MPYNDFVRPGGGDPDAILRVAALIAGLPPAATLRGAAELISATAVDADKVDYVNRDAAACGIPVGIDVARLFLRSCFLRVGRDVMKQLLPEEGNLADPETIFVVNASGVDTIEELWLARAALYQRVYLHQTTRNAERLLGRSFEAYSADGVDGTPENPPDALAIWAMDDFTLLKTLADHPMTNVANFGRRLRNRELPKRACSAGTPFTINAPGRDISTNVGSSRQ